MKPTKTLFPTCAALLVFAFACGGGGDDAPMREWTPADHGQPPMPDSDREPSEPSAPEDAQAATARAARALWNATCAGCHGRDGRGQGEAKPPGAQIPDFTSRAWQASRSDEQVAQVIRDGRGMMPGFGKQLNDQGIAVLLQHVRAFAAAQPAAPPETTQGAPAQP
jgi:mono/diheme cytochrome c family protein